MNFNHFFEGAALGVIIEKFKSSNCGSSGFFRKVEDAKNPIVDMQTQNARGSN